MAISSQVYASLNILYATQAPSASDISLWQTNPSLTSLSWEQTVLVFANSTAAKQTYPILQAPGAATDATRRQYVLQVFNNAYGLKEADLNAAEINYWVNWLGLTNNGAPADSDGNGIPNILDFPIVLNQYQSPAIQKALANRAQAALDFAQQFFEAGIATFDQALYDTSWNVISTVTADPASVAAAKLLTAQAVKDTIGGGTGTTFTLLDNGAVLTASANSKVAPEGKFLSTANNKVSALTFLNSSFVQDPSTSDNDVLTAQIVNLVAPNIENIETIQFSGAANAIVELAGISKAKQVEVVKGDLKIKDANNYAIDLVAGYASNLTLIETALNKDLTVNLNGTTAGASIAATLLDKSKVNLVVKAASVLSNVNTDVATLALDNTQSSFVITGDKNLTIDGNIIVFDGTNRLDATDFSGQLTLNLGKGSTITQIVGGNANDTFTLTAKVNQINGVALNGEDGSDTLTVKVGLSPTALDKVINVETIIFKEDTAADTKITTVDTLVASGATLTVDASSFTTKTLTFDGGDPVTRETNGSFKITGGALVDVLKGGEKNDTLTGGGGTDNLTGNGGNDQFLLNKATAGNNVNITDFSIVANNNDVFALSNAAFAGAPAVGAALTVSAVLGASNSANTILLDTAANLLTTNAINYGNVRFAYDTTNNKLYYDADGVAFGGPSSILIATTNAIPAPGLNVSNFTIVA